MTMATLFGDFRVRIDPWEVDYGDQTPLASLDDIPNEQVDHEVEVADGHYSKGCGVSVTVERFLW